MICPYPVAKSAVLCCLGDPCDLSWRRPCDDFGGCWDRSTCGDCSYPVISKETIERSYRNGIAAERQRIVSELREISRLSAEHKNEIGMLLHSAGDALANMIEAGYTRQTELGGTPQLLTPPADPNICPVCKRDFPNGGTCHMGGCPMGGDV